MRARRKTVGGYRFVPHGKRHSIRNKARERFWRRYDGPMRCVHCGRTVRRDLPEKHPAKATVDHLTPISRGGRSAMENLALACHECNNERGSKRGWRTARFGLVARLIEAALTWLAARGFSARRALESERKQRGEKSCEEKTGPSSGRTGSTSPRRGAGTGRSTRSRWRGRSTGAAPAARS